METVGGERTMAATEEIIEGLNDLLQLDHDAIGAYEIAIEKLEDRDNATQIAGFQRDHQRHVEGLNRVILELGGTPMNEPHATGPLKLGMQKLGAMAGDRGTLIAWRVNELQVRTKYDGYASRANRWPEHIKRLVDENALDEERHYHWVTQVLEAMGVPASEGLEQDAATRLREGAARLGQVTDQARERASAAAETARMRAADGLDTAAHRLSSMADRRSQPGAAPNRVGQAANRLAGGMESTADFLRSPDPERLRAGVEEQVRTNTVQTLLATFAVGFIIGRILR